jgi:uncharacterized protein YhfF
MSTPLPLIDPDVVAAFWQRAIDTGAVPPGTPLPELVEPFGDSVELADELIALVVDGPKRATAGSYDEYLAEGSPVPTVGMLSVATDGSGRPRAVMQTTDVRIGPLSSVDDQFAWDEGEGDRTRAWWLAAHQTFFRRVLPQLGLSYTDDMPTVFERFDVIYAE